MRLVIDLRIILLILFFISTSQIKVYCIFLFSILGHELAHIVCAKILKMQIEEVSFGVFGFSAQIYQFGKNKSLHRIFMYLAGPVFNLILSFLFYIFQAPKEFVDINLLLGLLNLMPILPLDGGRVLKEILKYFYDYKFANSFMLEFTKVNLVIISLVYSIAILKLKNVMILILIIYLWWLYSIEEKKMQTLKRVYGIIEKSIEKI